MLLVDLRVEVIKYKLEIWSVVNYCLSLNWIVGYNEEIWNNMVCLLFIIFID